MEPSGLMDPCAERPDCCGPLEPSNKGNCRIVEFGGSGERHPSTDDRLWGSPFLQKRPSEHAGKGR